MSIALKPPLRAAGMDFPAGRLCNLFFGGVDQPKKFFRDQQPGASASLDINAMPSLKVGLGVGSLSVEGTE